jgi:lysylphosphatidylglycerol synthetase-like protein (DUF2156 family)
VRRSGVVTFTGVLFLVLGLFNAVDGVVALAEPRHFYVTENGVLISNYDAFGVVLLVIAGIALLVGYGILARIRAAQVVGIIIVIVAAVVHMAYFKHYPAWSVIMLVLDAVMLYALTVHGDEFAPGGRRR